MRLAALAWRGLFARRLRTALTIIGIALGVALMTGTLIANEASTLAVRRAAAELYGHADLRVRAFDPAGFSARTVAVLRSLPAVQAAAAVSERRLTISTQPGPDEQIFNLLVVGVDPRDEARIRSSGLLSGEYLPASASGGALLNAAFARQHELRVGDDLLLVGSDPAVGPLRIVGLLDDAGLGAMAQGDVMVMQRAVLDAAFAIRSPVTAVDLVVEPDRAPEVQAALDQQMREPFLVETAADAERHFGAAQAGFAEIAFLFALVALAVGAFMVANAEAMFLGERTREIGLLRAAGATRAQVLTLFLRQGLAMGIVGSAVGVLLGTAIAALIIGFLGSTRAVLVSRLPMNPSSLGLAFVVGLTVSVAAAAIPSFAAARISPLEALRPSRRAARSLWQRLPWLLVLVLAAVLAGVVIYPLQRGAVSPVSLGLAVGILLAGMSVAASLLHPLGRVIGRPFEWFFGAQGMLGRANLGRDRARTGLTVGALILALAAVVALGTVAESTRASAERWVASILPGEYAIRLGVAAEIDAARPDLESTSGAAEATPIVEFPVTWRADGADREVSVAAIDPTAYEDAGSLIFTEGRRGRAFQLLRDGGAVLVPEAAATRFDLHPGSVLEIGGPGAETASFTVAGVIRYTLPASSPDGAYLISLRDAAARFGQTSASLWAFIPQPGIGSAAFGQSVAETAQSYAAAFLSVSQLAGELQRTLDRLIGLFDVLALIAVVIAGLGVVNTLSVGVAERAREIAILRSHGMTTGAVQAMVASEAAIMGAVGGVAAVATGLLAAWAITSGTAITDGGTALAVPGPLVLSVALLSIGVAALASLYPARLAAATSMVHSLQHFE